MISGRREILNSYLRTLLLICFVLTLIFCVITICKGFHLLQPTQNIIISCTDRGFYTQRTMKFGQQTTLTLSIDSCHELPPLEPKSELDKETVCEIAAAITAAKKSAEKTRDMVAGGTQDCCCTSDPEKSNIETEFVETTKHLIDAQQTLEKLVNRFQINGGDCTPNPFIIVTLDEDDGSTDVIAHTKTYRDTRRVLWQEDFKDIPLGLLAHGKWGRKLLKSGKQVSYCPSRLNFWIYHEDQTSDQPCRSSWKSDTPQRDHLLGQSYLSFEALMSKSGTVCHNLPVLDTLGNPISDCYLKIETEIRNATIAPDCEKPTTIKCETSQFSGSCCRKPHVTLEDFCNKESKSKKIKCRTKKTESCSIKCHSR